MTHQATYPNVPAAPSHPNAVEIIGSLETSADAGTKLREYLIEGQYVATNTTMLTSRRVLREKAFRMGFRKVVRLDAPPVAQPAAARPTT